MSDAKSDRFFWVDALRGVAALGVVLFHIRVDLWIGWREITAHPERYSALARGAAWFSAPMPFLGSGVMLFFVLSGFCIHWPQAGGRSPDWKTYAVRRGWRIAPPYLAAALLSLGAAWLASTWFHHGDSTANSTRWKTLLMLQNYGSERGQLQANPSLWSLPVELELYAVYPLFLWWWRRWGTATTFAVMAAISLAATVAWFSGQRWVEWNFAIYWPIWCAGAWLAEKSLDRTLPSPGRIHHGVLLLGAVGCVALDLSGRPEVVAHFYWGAEYFLLLWCALSLRALQGFGAKVLGWLGRISYSLYLIHFPFFFLGGAIWMYFDGGKPANLLMTLLFLPPCLLLAQLFHVLVEAPSHGWARTFARPANQD